MDRPRSRMRGFRFAALILAALFVSLGLFGGCTDRPRALPLTNDAVFENTGAGIRFLAPPGWAITSRGTVPPGEIRKPVLLVSYLQSSGEKPAGFELFLAEVPAEADLGQYLTEHRIGPVQWKAKGGAVDRSVGGLPGLRYALTAGAGKDEMRREATAVRRGNRAFYFVVSFGVRETEYRDQIEKSIDSVTWLK